MRSWPARTSSPPAGRARPRWPSSRGSAAAPCTIRSAPALAHGRVRFVGEPVAIVVAETEYLAQDAAELIEIEYEDLPVLVEAADAFSDKAATLHDGVPNNLAFDYVYGDADKTEKAFAEAAHVVKVELRAQRISGNPMEPKSCLARYDAANGHLRGLCCRARASPI